MNFSSLSPVGNEMYMKYKDEFPCWPLIASALVMSSIAFFGVFLNSAVIYVTLRTKTLNGTANLLLALTSLFELLHQYAHFQFLYLSLVGQNFIDYKLSVKICTVALFGLIGTSPTMLCTGIDRLISVLFIHFPKTVKRLPYLGGVAFVCAAYCTYAVCFIYTTVDSMQSVKVTGMIGDIFQGQASTVLGYGFYVNCATIFVYVTTGLIIRLRSQKNATTADKMNKRIFRSLCFIVSFNIGGYLLGKFYRVFVTPFLGSPITIWFGMIIVAIPVNVSSISNAPILFGTSTEYRKAFRHEWKRLRTFSVVGPRSAQQNGHNTNTFLFAQRQIHLRNAAAGDQSH